METTFSSCRTCFRVGTHRHMESCTSLHSDVEISRTRSCREHIIIRDVRTGWHTGRGLVRECAWTHAHHDQSMPCHDGAWRRHGHESTRIGDVGGRRRRQGANLKKPSTTRYAQSSTLDDHGGRWTCVGDARARRKVGRQKVGSGLLYCESGIYQ